MIGPKRIRYGLKAARPAATSAVRVEPVNFSATEAVKGMVATAPASGSRVSGQSAAPQSHAIHFSARMK